MLNKIKRASHKGYTLVEILVGVSIFMILIAASVEFFVSSLEMQQMSLSSQRLLDNVSYTFEYMSRALRMAKRAEDSTCIPEDKNYDITRFGQGIKFVNYNDECWEFYRNSTPNAANAHSLMVVRGGKEDAMTSEFLDAASFKIILSEIDGFQPKLTLFLDAKMIKNKKLELQPSIKIQTTISQRNLNE